MLGHILSYPWLHEANGQQVRQASVQKKSASFLSTHRTEANEGDQTQMSSVTVKNNLELQGSQKVSQLGPGSRISDLEALEVGGGAEQGRSDL